VPSYCGDKDKKYPDARQMGYPFDRLPPTNPQENYTIDTFITPNMAYSNVIIVHKNVFVNKQQGSLQNGINHDTHPIDKPPELLKYLKLNYTKDGLSLHHFFEVNGVKYFLSYSPFDKKRLEVRLKIKF
jgi:hypothetical protein